MRMTLGKSMKSAPLLALYMALLSGCGPRHYGSAIDEILALKPAPVPAHEVAPPLLFEHLSKTTPKIALIPNSPLLAIAEWDIETGPKIEDFKRYHWITLYDVTTQEQQFRWDIDGYYGVEYFDVDRQGNHVVAAGQRGFVILNLTERTISQEVRTWSRSEDIAISPNGDRLVLGDQVWDTASGAPFMTLYNSGPVAPMFQFSDDQRYLSIHLPNSHVIHDLLNIPETAEALSIPFQIPLPTSTHAALRFGPGDRYYTGNNRGFRAYEYAWLRNPPPPVPSDPLLPEPPSVARYSLPPFSELTCWAVTPEDHIVFVTRNGRVGRLDSDLSLAQQWETDMATDHDYLMNCDLDTRNRLWVHGSQAVYRLSLDGQDPAEAILLSPMPMTEVHVSEDGRRLAVVHPARGDNAGGRVSVYQVPD